MAKSARARSTCAAGALSERLRRGNSWRSSAVSGRRGSFWWRDMGHLGTRGSPYHYTSFHGRRPTSSSAHWFLVHAGRRHSKVALHVRLGRRTAMDPCVGIDEGQVLALLVREAGRRGLPPIGVKIALDPARVGTILGRCKT